MAKTEKEVNRPQWTAKRCCIDGRDHHYIQVSDYSITAHTLAAQIGYQATPKPVRFFCTACADVVKVE